MKPTRLSNFEHCEESAQHRGKLSPLPSPPQLAGEKRANIIIDQQEQQQSKYLPGSEHNIPIFITSNINKLYSNYSREIFLVYVKYIFLRVVLAIIGRREKDLFSCNNKLAVSNHGKGLLIVTETNSQTDSGAICDYPSEQEETNKFTSNQLTKKEESLFCSVEKQYKSKSRPTTTLHLVTLVILSLSSFQYAPTCQAFGISEYNLDSGLIGYSYPNEQNQQSPVTKSSWSQPIRTFMRQLNDDPMAFMSTMMGSLSQDQDSTGLPGQQSPTWTSILTNPFGLPQQQQRPSNQNNLDTLLDAHIRKILVPRVSGTKGNLEVREYIMNSLRMNNYHIELDEFTGSTPIGEVKFANIIASSNPKACRQLVLACHYDSKMMEGFLGAVDSAVPCAMLLRISETFNKSFRASSDEDDSTGTPSKDSLGLKFIFFDGEEAFVQWSSTDSLYGSRHLAAKWSKQQAPVHCKLGPNKSELSLIELFVLLDLIGSSDTSFVMYNTKLRHHYEALQRYERSHLTKAGFGTAQARRESAFKSRTMPFDFVEDDHVPFKQRNVPILLLLAHPFPRVWHTTNDNYDAIDFPKTMRILHTLEEFVANYSR